MKKEKDEILEKMMLIVKAEFKAYEEQGVEVGRIEYTCPVCGGTAVGSRIWHNHSYHNVGSHSSSCNI